VPACKQNEADLKSRVLNPAMAGFSNLYRHNITFSSFAHMAGSIRHGGLGAAGDIAGHNNQNAEVVLKLLIRRPIYV
jgi:hypothetical protein